MTDRRTIVIPAKYRGDRLPIAGINAIFDTARMNTETTLTFNLWGPPTSYTFLKFGKLGRWEWEPSLLGRPITVATLRAEPMPGAPPVLTRINSTGGLEYSEDNGSTFSATVPRELALQPLQPGGGASGDWGPFPTPTLPQVTIGPAVVEPAPTAPAPVTVTPASTSEASPLIMLGIVALAVYLFAGTLRAPRRVRRAAV